VVGAAEIAAIDAEIAGAAQRWGPLSDRRVEALAMVTFRHVPRSVYVLLRSTKGLFPRVLLSAFPAAS
jgi:hypothetical protein